jgi:multicomponent Na+:H+ antiporter subunit C
VSDLLARLPYLVVPLLSGVGLLVLVEEETLVRKVLGLNLFQTGIFLFFVLVAVRTGGRSPLVVGEGPYVNPLPHVLVLTAIVVGVSVTALALSLVVRIDEETTETVPEETNADGADPNAEGTEQGGDREGGR